MTAQKRGLGKEYRDGPVWPGHFLQPHFRGTRRISNFTRWRGVEYNEVPLSENSAHRPVVIACVLSVFILVVVAVLTLRQRLEVRPMPAEMQCVVKRNCSTPDFIPGAPLTAPPFINRDEMQIESKKPRTHTSTCDFSRYHPVRISSDWMWRGGIVKRVKPEYPPEVKMERIQGEVAVRVLIDRNGEVEQACGTGPALLRDAAERAALGWLFRPPRLNGEPFPYIQEVLVFKFVPEEPE
jgi:TonB family protein